MRKVENYIVVDIILNQETKKINEKEFIPVDIKFQLNEDKINNYLNIVKIILEKKGTAELNSINDKIYDYVMSKIYDKIYPIEPYEEDNKIFQQSIRLSWTEPKHFIKSKRQLVFGSFLTDVISLFMEKSPRKKLFYMSEIFNSIGFLLKFNGAGQDARVDDHMPILNYAFVKAQTFKNVF